MATSDLSADIDELIKGGLISEVVGELKSGKEATVHLVRDSSAGRLLALKHYRAMRGRGFTSEAKYREGRFMRARDARAFRKRTRYGRTVAQQSWIAQEFHMLRRLHRSGVPIPQPIAMAGASILMEFIAESPGSARPAPRLVDVELAADEARRFHGRLMQAVIIMMKRNVVHADLSPYNVLAPKGGAANASENATSHATPTPMATTTTTTPTPAPSEIAACAANTTRRPIIIDFPQAVDPRFNSAAPALLAHDIEQITTHLRRFDNRIDDRDLAHRLWRQFADGSL